MCSLSQSEHLAHVPRQNTTREPSSPPRSQKLKDRLQRSAVLLQNEINRVQLITNVISKSDSKFAHALSQVSKKEFENDSGVPELSGCFGLPEKSDCLGYGFDESESLGAQAMYSTDTQSNQNVFPDQTSDMAEANFQPSSGEHTVGESNPGSSQSHAKVEQTVCDNTSYDCSGDIEKGSEHQKIEQLQLQERLSEVIRDLQQANKRILDLEIGKTDLVNILAKMYAHLPSLELQLSEERTRCQELENQLVKNAEELVVMTKRLNVAENKASLCVSRQANAEKLDENVCNGTIGLEIEDTSSSELICQMPWLLEDLGFSSASISYDEGRNETNQQFAKVSGYNTQAYKQLESFEKSIHIQTLRADLPTERYNLSIERCNVSVDFHVSQVEWNARMFPVSASDLNYSEGYESSFFAELNKSRSNHQDSMVSSLSEDYLATKHGMVARMNDKKATYSISQANDELAQLQRRVVALNDIQCELDDTKEQLQAAIDTIANLQRVANLQGDVKRRTQASDEPEKRFRELELHLAFAQSELTKAKSEIVELEQGYTCFLEDAMDSIKSSDAEAKILRRKLRASLNHNHSARLL